ncbi:SDR family oxidoreductase [Bordetella bronchialis]|nr:SDR family oxidoreductase [Bordetella bronchialis]
MTDRRRSGLERWASLRGVTLEEAVARFPREAGIARFGESQEVADLMAFLVSPAARWMTGAALRVDGGEVQAV